ncbi:MAG TPA: TetR/AcrR family transcriptional regulator [Acidimicrobiales bacterium]|nr:TetR/AcrR family transcriptional regulator [Acidimicrobiales bacterium]
MGAIATSERTGADKVADADLACIADHGVRALTVERVAVEAGVSRASVYRWFPGGRTDVLLAAGHREMARFFSELEPRLAAAPTLDDCLAEGLATTVRFLQGSRPLQSLLAHEPELVLPHLAFDRMGTAFDVAASVAVHHVHRFLGDPDARRAVELVARLALSHTLSPSADLDVGDVDVARRLVHRFVTPGLLPSPTIPPGADHVRHR